MEFRKKMWRLTGKLFKLMDEQSGKDEDKKEEGKVKADADAADESGVHGLEQSEKDIEDAPSDAEEPKKKKEKKRFGFFNRHS